MLQPLKETDFEQLYDLMKDSFPEDEYRPFEGQKALLAEEAYQIYANYNEVGILQAFVALWNFEQYAYIEHFAVNPRFRNGGLGSRILKELADTFPKPIFLEVEPPKDEMAIRRIGFYERNGYHLNTYPYMQPAMAPGRNPIPLCIMTSQKPVTVEEFDTIKQLLYEKVFKIL